MFTQTVFNQAGKTAVVISANSPQGPFTERVYVNCEALSKMLGTAISLTKKAKRFETVERWSKTQLREHIWGSSGLCAVCSCYEMSPIAQMPCNGA